MIRVTDMAGGTAYVNPRNILYVQTATDERVYVRMVDGACLRVRETPTEIAKMIHIWEKV